MNCLFTARGRKVRAFPNWLVVMLSKAPPTGPTLNPFFWKGEAIMAIAKVLDRNHELLLH